MGPGDRFGQYEIVHLFDDSAFTAWDYSGNREVAIQLLEVDPRRVSRFSHPNLPAVLDTGYVGRQAYATLEIVHGDVIDLVNFGKEHLKREIRGGISALHREGLAHERLLFKNLAVRQGRVLLRWPKFSTKLWKDGGQMRRLLAEVESMGEPSPRDKFRSSGFLEAFRENPGSALSQAVLSILEGLITWYY